MYPHTIVVDFGKKLKFLEVVFLFAMLTTSVVFFGNKLRGSRHG